MPGPAAILRRVRRRLRGSARGSRARRVPRRRPAAVLGGTSAGRDQTGQVGHCQPGVVERGGSPARRAASDTAPLPCSVSKRVIGRMRRKENRPAPVCRATSSAGRARARAHDGRSDESCDPLVDDLNAETEVDERDAEVPQGLDDRRLRRRYRSRRTRELSCLSSWAFVSSTAARCARSRAACTRTRLGVEIYIVCDEAWAVRTLTGPGAVELRGPPCTGWIGPH